MGEPIPANQAPQRADLFERVVAAKLRKTFDDTIQSVMENFDFSENIEEMMNEMTNEIINERSFRARIKARVLEAFSDPEMHERFAKKIIDQMIK